LRPVSVNPFPFDVLDQLAAKASAFLVVEMNQGQMLNDVQLAVKGRIPVEFYGRPGGTVPFPNDILNEIKRMTTSKLSIVTDPRVAWLQRTLA
jgi:2-oxoglutarate ferredoxin oxidoreductase subunit alpha